MSPHYNPWMTRCCSDVQLYWFLSSALNGNEKSVACSGRFSPEVSVPLPTVEMAESVPGPVWTEKEISFPIQLDHMTVQPVACSCTNDTTLGLLITWNRNITVMFTVSCTVGHAHRALLLLLLLLLCQTEFKANSVCVNIMSYTPATCTYIYTCDPSVILNIWLLLQFIIRWKQQHIIVKL